MFYMKKVILKNVYFINYSSMKQHILWTVYNEKYFNYTYTPTLFTRGILKL